MPALLPVPFLIACVFFLLRAELARPRDVRQVRLWKPAATAMTIASALLALPQTRTPVYVLLIVIGLAFCLAGDVYLIDGDRPGMFMRGLASFLVGHIVFIAALTSVQSVKGAPLSLDRELAVAGVLALFVLLMFLYMRANLGAMQGPVLLYMVVIALMAHRAIGGVDLSMPFPSQAALAAGGSILFMISDSILALNRFMFPPAPGEPEEGRDKIWVLTTYYAAITLLALSCAYG